MTSEAAAPDAMLGREVGSYRIVAAIGAGGMGRVYRAEQPRIGARVAIKVLSIDVGTKATSEMVARFFAEARAVNLIRHESIVNVLDLGQLPEGTPYIVMEYLDGASLGEHVRRRGALPAHEVMTIALDVLSALDAAHQRGIVHRDLKPDNVFVTPGGRAKVLDFGLAKLLPEAELARSWSTRSSAMLGTPPYLAPEQLLGGTVDARTDLWALGVTLYEAALGRRPFEARQLFDLFKEIAERAPTPPRQLRPELPEALERAILAALNKRSDERPASARAMAELLVGGAAAPAPGPDPEVTAREKRRDQIRLDEAARPMLAQRGEAEVAEVEVEPTRQGAGRRVGALAAVGLALVLVGAVAMWWVMKGRSQGGQRALLGDAGTAGRDAGTEVAAAPVDAGLVVAGGPAVKGRGGRAPRSPTTTPSATARPTPTATPAATPAATPTAAPTPSSDDPPPGLADEEEPLSVRIQRGSIDLPGLPPPWSRFVLDDRLPALLKVARKVYPDAYLLGMNAFDVDMDGVTDLPKVGLHLEYRSPSREANGKCALSMAVLPNIITVSVRDSNCNIASRAPRCSVKQARAKAAALGVDTAKARVDYWWGKWRIDFKDAMPDDC